MKAISIIFIFLFSSLSYSACYQVSVTVSDKKPDGSSWDIGGGLPDIKVCFDDAWGYRCKVKNRKKAYCEDSLKCDLGIIQFDTTTTKVEVVDVDEASDDAIGARVCNVTEKCDLGSATVEFKKAACE